MGKNLSKIATDVARRWVAARSRREKRGANVSAPTFDEMRDFASFSADDADAVQLDIITDLAIQKIGNLDRTSEART